MSLPSHKGDLLDLKKQIEDKLKELEGPLLIPNDGQWHETFGRKCAIPKGTNAHNTKGEWKNHAGQINDIHSFDVDQWLAKGITAIRLTSFEVKVPIRLEFTTYVPELTKFVNNAQYLLILRDNDRPVTIMGRDIRYPQNIQCYRFLQLL